MSARRPPLYPVKMHAPPKVSVFSYYLGFFRQINYIAVTHRFLAQWHDVNFVGLAGDNINSASFKVPTAGRKATER